GAAASCAFLMHAPTTFPFWAVYGVLALWPSGERRERLYGFAPLTVALVLLWIASRGQSGGAQVETFLSRLDPNQESLQRMRASYNWISVWARAWLGHYLFLYAVTLAATVRLRNRLSPEMRLFALGLPLIGILSLPLSWLMLEKMRLALTAQLQ